MIHVLEKHRFPVSIVETLFLAGCFKQWRSVWEMLASECICLFFFFPLFFKKNLDSFQIKRQNRKTLMPEALFLCFQARGLNRVANL